jgi:hypothetical protein
MTINQRWAVAFICTLPFIFVADTYAFSWIQELLRAKDDLLVGIGSVLLCVLIFLNYVLFKFLGNKTIKTK